MAPAFTLYSSRGSSNGDRVRLTLAEGGFTDYKLEILDLAKGEQKSEAHLKLHPWGKVPAVAFPDGFSLYESRAICKYLARKYSFPLLPPDSDLEARALFEQAESVEAIYYADPAAKFNLEKVVKPLKGLPSDEAAATAALDTIEKFFDVLDGILQHNQYVAGKEFTVADIYYIPLIQRMCTTGYGNVVQSRKAVGAWWERISNRPAIKKVLDADKAAAAAAAAARK